MKGRKKCWRCTNQYPNCPPPPGLIQMEAFTKGLFLSHSSREKNNLFGLSDLCLNYSVGYLRWTSNIDVYRNRCAVILMINCAQSGEYYDVTHVNERRTWRCVEQWSSLNRFKKLFVFAPKEFVNPGCTTQCHILFCQICWAFSYVLFLEIRPNALLRVTRLWQDFIKLLSEFFCGYESTTNYPF